MHIFLTRKNMSTMGQNVSSVEPVRCQIQNISLDDNTPSPSLRRRWRPHRTADNVVLADLPTFFGSGLDLRFRRLFVGQGKDSCTKSYSRM